ncbi:MAG TPA: protein kinase [Phycisphaerales bacterium]|nr:protein kinase [Phycisphaerales bacterium]HMP38410.1 protein kinase [Phycisphaerales bacterium]
MSQTPIHDSAQVPGAAPRGGAPEREAMRLFRRALDEPAASRQELLDRECDGRPALRTRVEALLDSIPAAETFLERPAIRSLAESASEDGIGLIGARVGRYRILDRIAAGGMGVVYLAEQESPRRSVAVKVMRAGLPSAKSRRLFEHEAQVLGRLEHPNVARIYEAAVHMHGPLAAPLPFFAMEHVEGAVPITAFARERRLSLPERIAIFRKACLGVHHGHQKGIIHRDLKPANIIVDRSGEPRVIDYGVAVVTGGDLEATRAASDAAHFVGTLRYMSPEQCAGNAAAVDVRSDVYALGVILYELLCDRHPFDHEDRSPLELQRAVMEAAPLRPRQAAPDLPRELEAILLKAMARATDDRYQSAADLERDLGRWLRHEPIEARRASTLHAARLFVRRHRTLIAAGTFAAVAGLAAVVVGVVFGITAVAAERRAAEERDAALRRQYFADLAAAESALRANEFGRLRTHLASAPAAHRGWEWEYLQQRSEPSVLVLERPVIADSVAISPGRGMIIAGWRDGVVDARSIDDGSSMGSFQARRGVVLDLAISPDDASVAIATARGAIELADLDTFQRRWSSDGGHGNEGGGATASGVVFAPDGSRLISVGHDGAVRCWSAESGTELWHARMAPGRTRRLTAIAHHPGRDEVATAGADGAIDLWNSLTGEPLGTLDGHPESQVLALRYSADGSLLCSGANDRTIAIWHLATRSRARTLVGHERSVWSIALGPDPSTIISTSVDHTIRQWSIDGGEPLGTWHGHGDTVADVAVSPDGARIVTASWDRTVRVWLPWGESSALPQAARESIDRMAVSADGRVLVTSQADQPGAATGRVLLRDAATLELLGTIEREGRRPRPIAISPDGALLATGWTDGIATVHDLRTGALVQSIAAHRHGVLATCFDPVDGALLTGGRDSMVRLWCPQTGAPRGSFESASSSVNGIVVSADGARLATFSHDGTAELWERATLRPVATLGGHLLSVYDAVFSPDGRSLLTGSRDQTIRVWDARTGALDRVLEGHGQWVTRLAFLPDGSRLVSTSWFETLSVWSADLLEPVVSMRGHGRPIRSLAITPEGDVIFTGDDDGNVRIWDRRSRSAKAEDARLLEAAQGAARSIVAELLAADPSPGAAASRLQATPGLTRGVRHVAMNALLRRGLDPGPLGSPQQDPDR